VAYALLDEVEIINLCWLWRSLTTSTVGCSSDSWACCFCSVWRPIPSFLGRLIWHLLRGSRNNVYYLGQIEPIFDDDDDDVDDFSELMHW